MTVTATESVSYLWFGKWAIQHGVEHWECRGITVAAPGSTPVPTLTMADGGTISVATVREQGVPATSR